MITFPLLALSSLILAIPTAKDVYRGIFAPKKLKKTHNEVYSWGFVFGIIGQLGIGKTTKTNGLMSLLETFMKDLINDKEEYTFTIINKMDFTYLNFVLKVMCENHEDCKPEEVLEKVYPIVKPYMYDKNEEDLIYNNGIKKIKYEEIMLEYIEAIIAKHRNNFVWCNIEYESAITGNKAYDLSPEDTKIKDRWKNHDFTLRRYGMQYFDDVALEEEKINLNWQKMASENSGSIEFLRTYRHLFKENNRYVCNLQNAGRLVKTDRELFNSIIEIESKEDYERFAFCKKILSFIDIVNDFSHKIRVKLTWNKARLEEKKSKYRNRKRKLWHSLDLLDSKDYIKYTVNVYDTSKDADNKTNKSKHTSIYFPKKWCYSPTETFAYSYLYDALIQTSTASPRRKESKYYIEDKIALAEKMLKK